MIKRLVNSKFKKDLLFSYFSQGYGIILGFFQLYLINKYFGIEVFGQFSIIVSSVGIFSSIFTARSSEAVTRFFARELLKNNYENAKFILFIGFFIDFITAIILIVVIYLLSDKIANYFLKDKKLDYEVFLYSFVTFFLFIRGTVGGYMLSNEMIVKIKVIEMIESTTKIVFLSFFIFVLSDISLKTLIYSMIFASFTSLLYAYYIFMRSYIAKFKNVVFSFNKDILKEYWSFNLKTFFSSSLKAGNQNIDNLILGYFINSETVGIYQILKKIASPILVIASPFSMMVYPKLINYFETNQKDKFKEVILKISLYIFIFAILYSFISYIFIDDIVKFLSINYVDIYGIYYILILILSLFIAEMWWVRIFSNTVNPNYSIYMNIFSTVYQLSIIVFLSKIFGFIGLLIGLIFMNLFILLFWLRKGYRYVYRYIYT